MKKIRYILATLCTVAVIAVVLAGCKKDKATEAATEQSTVPMLKFESFDDVFNYMTDKNTKSEMNGFVSYAEMIEKDYIELDPENYFKSKEEMVQYALDHNDKYQLILCDDGEYIFESRLFNHDFKYIANTDGIFQVKDSVYKIIEGGLVFTNLSNLEELIAHIDDGYRRDNNIFKHIIFDNSENTNDKVACSNSHNLTKTNGNNQLFFETKLYTSDSHAIYKHYAKPYHHNFLGWFGCLRTITCSYDNKVSFKDKNGTWWPEHEYEGGFVSHYFRWEFREPQYITTGKFESVRYSYLPLKEWMWAYEHPNTGGFGFNRINAKASTPDVGEITFYCIHDYF